MGFLRVLVKEEGAQSQILRAGAGYVANVSITNLAAESDETITIAELSGGCIQQGTTLTSDVIYTLPTAALIVAEWPEMDVGDAFTFYAANNQAAAFDVVLALGVGMTVIGTNNNLTIAPQSSKMFTVVKTSATTHDLY